MILLDQISYFLPLMASLIFAFLVAGLVTFKEDQHKVLFAFFILISLNRIIAFFTKVPEFSIIRIWLEPLAYLLILSIIPIYFLYLKSIIKGRFPKTDFYHFIPACILFLLFLLPYLFIPNEEKIQYIHNYITNAIENDSIKTLFSTFPKIVAYSYYTQLLIYFALILRLIINHLRKSSFRKLIKNKDPSLKRIFIYVLAIVIAENYGVFIDIFNVQDPIIVTNLVFFFLVIFLGYSGLKHEFVNEHKVNKRKVDIPEDIKQQLYTNIKILFDQKEIFLNSKLTLRDLVNELNSNKTYVSIVIREKFKQSFISLLTEYRIEKAKKLLIDESASNYSIEGIGKISGFNLKSTFYTVFKKETGFTPSNYVKHMTSGN